MQPSKISADSRQLADGVFRGKVISIQHLTGIGQRKLTVDQWAKATDDHQEVAFLVDAVWKGSVGRQVKVYVTAHPSWCDGYVFRLGSEYVVYASFVQVPAIKVDETVERLRAAIGLKVSPPSVDTHLKIDDCPLRIIVNVESESRILGSWHSPKSSCRCEGEQRFA